MQPFRTLPIPRMILNTVIILCIAYGGVLLALVVLQRSILFQPGRDMQSPTHYGLLIAQSTIITAEDGVKLALWHHEAQTGFPTIVYFHGNAGHLGDRVEKFKIWAQHGFGVIALSYRGYGSSEGTPTETGMYMDARAALAYATDAQHIPLSHILLYGESLGSGVAVQMATEYRIGGLVLEAPYTAVVDRAAELYPYIPVRMLMKDRFDSLNKIERVHCPLLLFHGEIDPVIPVHQGRALFARANEPKHAIFYPGVGHVEFDLNVLADEILAFSRTHKLIR